MATFVDHLHSHLTHPRHVLHNVLISIGLCGLLMAIDQFYTGDYSMLAAGVIPERAVSIVPEPEVRIRLIPATNSVRGVCYISGTDMWDVKNHRVCSSGEPVCRTIHGYVVGCESKRIIR